MSDAGALTEIEAAIDAVVPVRELRAMLDTCADLADAPGELGVRYTIARGIVENRGELPRSALAFLQRARSAALQQGVTSQLARISREIARVRSWRGDITAASMELLRSVAEIEAAEAALLGAGAARDREAERIEADRAATIAEIGRLDIEAGRYEAALVALAEAARQAPAYLPPRETGRIAYNRCEALFGLGKADECMALIEQSLPLFSSDFPRDLFRLRLLKARCLIEAGRSDDAAEVARQAKAATGDDDFYEAGAEWQLFEGLLKAHEDPEAAIAALRRALLRFADSNLPRYEVDAGVRLAEILAAQKRMPEAEAAIAEALRRATGLPALADQVRTAAFDFWPADKLADLAGENALDPQSHQHSRFLVMATLGSGGFGTVQRAIDMETGEEVAIKRLHPDRGPSDGAWQQIERSVRSEIEAARLVPSRYAARTRYLNLDSSGDLVLVQDFVDGPTLRKVLNDGTTDLASRLGFAAQLTRAVAALHQHKVAHRDLKPDNVILRHGVEPVLIDLGLASLMGTSDVFSGMGTPGYAPPEQWKAGTDPKFTGREDVYALGRMIEELGGAPPPDDRWSSRWRTRLRGMSGHGPDLSDWIRRMVAHMTETDPAKRDVDLGELAGALDAAVAAARENISSTAPVRTPVPSDR